MDVSIDILGNEKGGAYAPPQILLYSFLIISIVRQF